MIGLRIINLKICYKKTHNKLCVFLYLCNVWVSQMGQILNLFKRLIFIVKCGKILISWYKITITIHMKIGIKVREKIARTIGQHFTTNEIVNVFSDVNIPTDQTLYAKWRITLDAFSKIETEERFFHILEEFCHPLNFIDLTIRQKFIDELNQILSYENQRIETTERMAKVISLSEKDSDIIEDNNTEAVGLPDINKSTFSEKVIELVANCFCNQLSNWDIRKIITPILEKNPALYNEKAIKGYLIDDMFEENPFWSFNDTLNTIRKKDDEADKHIAEIIETLLHPLNHNADESKTEEIAEKLNKYLRYDNFYIQNTGKDYIVLSEADMIEMHTSSPEFEEQEKQNKKEDEENIRKNKELIRELRDTHQSYIDILEIFCGDTKKPTKELNDAYIFLSNRIEKTIKELGLKTYYLHFHKPFKNDLYSAEMEKIKQGSRLSWDNIRPTLYVVHSDITKILNMTEEDTQMTDEEKKLENITKLISEKRTQKVVSVETQKTMKIEISKMPDLNVRNVEDSIIVKNKKKRTTLPKFPRTEWTKVSITFLDETNILLSDGKSTKPSSFIGMGCEDGRNGRSDENWAFLLKLAKGNGQTPPLSKKERQSEKKQKQKITDILRKIFNNDSDPFETEAGGVYKAKFNIKYNTDEKEKPNNKYSDLENFHSEMTESTQENITYDAKHNINLEAEGEFSQ